MDTSFLTHKTPLILLSPKPSIDAIASAYALAHAYVSAEAHPTLVCADDIHAHVSFLPQPHTVRTRISGTQDFVLQFDTAHNAIDDVTISRTDTAVEIIVTPEKDFIDPRDFSFAPSRMHYDGIVIIGAASLENTDLCDDATLSLISELPQTVFSDTPETPIISMSIYEALHAHDEKLIIDTVAHSILTGIVAATNGLRSDIISATIFRTSAALMRSGADLQAIMMALYKTVSLDFLRLWGGFLDRLTLTDNGHVAYAVVPSLYEADRFITAMILLRTAQFLPHTTALCVLWHKNNKHTQGMIFTPAHNALVALTDIFDTTTPTTNNCVFVTTDRTVTDIITAIDTHLETHDE